MSAETRGPRALHSGAPWETSTAGKDVTWSENHRLKTSSQKCCFLGFETKSELVWRDWDLQKQLTKTLVLKNTNKKLQKLHVRPPVSKFFTTFIPQTIFLSPGTSFSVPITFRPLQRCEYEDSIEFQCKDGTFQVRLRATVPCPGLEVPDSVLLPLCAVDHSSQTTFTLSNVSKVQTCFQWECTSPFHMSPERGLLKPGQDHQITVVFQPKEALVYQQQAYCRFDEEEEDRAQNVCSVLLQGLAKYPCLQLRTSRTTAEKQLLSPELHFGSVPIGQSLQKCFDIVNPSPVCASFSVSPLSDREPLLESVFSSDRSRGEVAPGGSLQVTLTYTPAVVDTTSVEYLSLKCRGALSETLLKVTGRCIGPRVSLSSSVVDFGCVDEGGSVVQTVELVNSSPVEAVYQWDLDCSGHSVFSIQPAGGTVQPQSRVTLKAVYQPTQPIAHHRTVPCLILHREPVFLDLIGTCHSELQKPVVLKPEHLVLYKLKWGCKQDPPAAHSSAQRDQQIHLDQQGEPSPPQELQQDPNTEGVLSRTSTEEYFHRCWGDPLPLSSSSPHVSVEPSELLFNHRSSLTASWTSSQSVSITNHTSGNLSLVWTLAQDSQFSVSPSSCDLAPLKTTSFRVNYEPTQINSLHGAQLECFAYLKQDNPLLGGQLLCPPWSVTVRVVGHSFQTGKERFVPRCSLKPSQVVFPAHSLLSYHTVLLQNCGELPLTFCLDRTSGPALVDSVSVVPSCGLIQPWNHQILTVRATPTGDSPQQETRLHLQLNASEHTKDLVVVRVVEKICLSQEGDGSLHFQPTAVGSQTQRSHSIWNLSRLPLCFRWSVPEPEQELICVEPDAGELQPNERSVQTWSFRPLEERSHTLKPTLIFWPKQTPESRSQLTLRAAGAGAKGFIKAEKEVLDVGEILIGSCRSVEVPLVNISPCPVSFHLCVEQTLLDEDSTHGLHKVPRDLKLDRERGTIASHSTMPIRLTVRPHGPVQYQWIISYQTLNARGHVLSPPTAVCRVTAQGVFPTLKVTDVCGRGSAERLSRVHLWKLFSLDRFNEYLTSSPVGLRYRTPKRLSARSSPPIVTMKMLDFNFSAAPLHSDPSTFMLMFHNPGPLPVDWSFLFPEDQQMELDYWAETGEFSSTELYQMKVQDNQQFNIFPRSGTLFPDQQRAVYFSYSHDFAGTDRFPVVFRVSNGSEMMLNFRGVTVDKDEPYLHFASKHHTFTSVPVGESHPPRQVYELHNGGAVPVHYQVDRAMLLELQVDNFNHSLLRCINPEGVVQPGGTAVLEWIFSPLEAKVYRMDVFIHVQNGNSTLVTFEGRGIKSPSQRSTNNDMKKSCVQRPPFPGQVAVLSEDRVSLGDITVGSRSSRILYLTNVTPADTVHYSWDQQSPQQVVQIHPQTGVLSPGDSAALLLSFSATDCPSNYQLDVTCQIALEAALSQYHDALQHWEEEKERQRVEFTITNNHLEESPMVLIDQEPAGASAEKETEFRRYKTLPAIICSRARRKTENSLLTRQTRAERRAQREAAKVKWRPDAPRPLLLHLDITARSRSHGQLKEQLEEQQRLHQWTVPLPPAASSSVSPRPADPDRDITVDVLHALLRDILSDFSRSWISSGFRSVPRQHPEETLSQCSPLPTSHPTSSSPRAAPPPQLLLSETKAGQDQQPALVDRQGTAGGSVKEPQTESMRMAPAGPCEEVLLRTLQNLMMEAVRGELILTAHPRSVNLFPPREDKRTS
ncbi:cilia- and flagella-associated protein 65 isoform X4 [Xyrichtys novacula]|uniref:Cilia- and flagella-associated protein 65 isoform X4 n=1 Tax=Xyrichtys novacula TaxID=13765 RepID=A0AAV1GDL4_XYRNO|nr:cilia- and flagella-associated protein 65 isoform X4 [Xyrichtys novacula]